MAQWLARPHDPFPPALADALRILRSAADAWSWQGDSAPQVEEILKVLHYALFNPWTGESMPLSLASCIARAGPLAAECALSKQMRSPEKAKAAVAELRQILTTAMERWSTGNAEEPPTERVLHAFALAMFHHGLVRRPPPPHIEEEVH
jgi:hypothetical protein